MDIEIIGEITFVETFAVGHGIHELTGLLKFTAKAVGVSAKALLWCNCRTVREGLPKFIGTNHQGLAEKSLRLNDS
jgi:hypothetical protein